jgi:hypothetical protein
MAVYLTRFLGWKDYGEGQHFEGRKKGLVVGNGSVFTKIMILIEDHSGTTLIHQKEEGVGIEPEGMEGLALKRGGIW